MKPVAIGVPRSGTHYFATLMGWHHEKHYRPGCKNGKHVEPEVSWAAVPFVDPQTTFIIHLVRHPLKVLASNIHRDWLKKSNSWGKFAHRHTGTWNIFDFYVHWFDWVEQLAHSTVRLEDIEHLGPPTNQFGTPEPVTIPEQYRDEIAAIAQRHGYGAIE